MTSIRAKIGAIVLLASIAGACNSAPTAPHAASIGAKKPAFDEAAGDTTSRNGGTAGSGYRISANLLTTDAALGADGEEGRAGGGTAGSGY